MTDHGFLPPESPAEPDPGRIRSSFDRVGEPLHDGPVEPAPMARETRDVIVTSVGLVPHSPRGV